MENLGVFFKIMLLFRETFKKIKFLMDVIKNERIIQLFDEIVLLQGK